MCLADWQISYVVHGYNDNDDKDKKLGCLRETARCFVSLKISPLPSRSLKDIQNDTIG